VSVNDEEKEEEGLRKTVMTDECIIELQDFETKDYNDRQTQTPEQLKEFKSK
jgi:hypothetical protein